MKIQSFRPPPRTLMGPGPSDVHAIAIPDGTDDDGVRRRLLEEYQLEIGAGLGPLAGKIWRVGLMGYSSRRENIDKFLTALGAVL